MKFLVVDDEPRSLFAISALLENAGGVATLVETGVAVVMSLDLEPDIGIVLVDINMPVMNGYETIRAIRDAGRFSHVRVVAVTGKVTAGERKRCLDAGADAYLPKPVEPAELFSVLRPWFPPPPSPVLIDGALSGLTVLVVDDDFRNIFAMTALLERGDASVIAAESGAEAVAALQRYPDVDVVLMDIMMPTMDGYDTIRAIRRISGFDVLPIVAVTGKAEAGERERCLESGADDYLAKPVDTAALLAVLVPWLPVRASLGAG